MPISDHDWTDDEVKKYYEWSKKTDEEIRTIGKEIRQRNNGGFSMPGLEDE